MRQLRSDEYPTENLPALSTRVKTPTPRRPLVRRLPDEISDDSDDDGTEQVPTQDVGVNTEENRESEKLEAMIMELEGNIKELTECGHSESRFSLETNLVMLLR